MTHGLVEIVGLFLVVAGLAGLVAAASLVSLALAVAVAGSFLVLLGIVAVYVAAQFEAAAKQPQEPPTVT